MANALWSQSVAAIALALCFVEMPKSLYHAEYAFSAYAVLEGCGMAILALGALRVVQARLPETRSRAFVISGLIALACAGVFVVLAPYIAIANRRGFVGFGDLRILQVVEVAGVAAAALLASAMRGIPALARLRGHATAVIVALLFALFITRLHYVLGETSLVAADAIAAVFFVRARKLLAAAAPDLPAAQVV